jgi:hypothetical protein
MIRTILVGAAVCCLVFGAFAFAGAQNSAQSPSPAAPTSDVPAFHATPPHDPLPATLDPSLFPDILNQNIYALAAKEKKILYQQPCYCRCDREVGHKSLLDCYVDRHASVCATCKMEAVFAYQESRKGKSAAEIRQEIMDGKWRNVDLSSYNLPATAPAKTQ